LNGLPKSQAGLFWVEVGKSVDEILAHFYLTTEIKAGHVKTVGVILDADTNPVGRYQRIHQLCGAIFPTLPLQLPDTGLIVDNDDGKRFGLWLMPDNESAGDLESFLRRLVPEPQSPLWLHACDSVTTATSKGAPCRDPHIPKANLYTWLAWQDPPGQSPGSALTRKILEPQSAHAESFVRWFKGLYRV